MPLSFSAPDKFLSADEEAWWASVDKALKGRPRQKLFETTDDGFENAPLYAGRTDTPARTLRRTSQEWSVVQRIEIPDPEQANAQMLEDLEGGASGLELVFSGAVTSNGNGIRATCLEDIEILFKGIQLELIDLRIEAGECSAEILALVLAYLEKNNVDPSNVAMAIGNDPFSKGFSQGSETENSQPELDDLLDTLESVRRLGSPVRLMQADGRLWHDAGATPVQELACVLASAAAHLRVLEASGIPADEWAGRISICLVADADQIGTIAKARAFRALWSCVLDGAELPQVPAHVHMSTSFRMLTRRDPWVNLLRNTVAAFAAGVGGADSIGVLPHTMAVGLPDGFARRLARNTQSILLEESSLAKVVDPAAGSGAIEDRTEKLCAAAWELFQEIEAAGGMSDALDKGLVQNLIAQSTADRERNIAHRKQPITGVSEFPDLNDGDVKVLAGGNDGRSFLPNPALNLPQAADGARFDTLRKLAASGQPLLVGGEEADKTTARSHAQAVEWKRNSAPFENLRAMADEMEKRTGSETTVFLASLGSLAEFTARATWVSNAFAVGGIRAVGPQVFDTLEALVAAFKESGATMACIVSTDALYEEKADETARALKTAGAGHLYLAGKPGANEQVWRGAGVDTFLFAGCNLLTLLEDAHARLQKNLGVDLSDMEVLK